MRIESTECLCATCGKVTKHARKVSEINHVMWALLGLLTCGACWFVWLLLVMTQFKTNWACQECVLKEEQDLQAKPLATQPDSGTRAAYALLIGAAFLILLVFVAGVSKAAVNIPTPTKAVVPMTMSTTMCGGYDCAYMVKWDPIKACLTFDFPSLRHTACDGVVMERIANDSRLNGGSIVRVRVAGAEYSILEDANKKAVNVNGKTWSVLTTNDAVQDLILQGYDTNGKPETKVVRLYQKGE